ncbi:MAG: hypothetical protein IPP91_04350 [Betaproteobacteria bacterium]|nr:hypothetical protein [Betaproteobacteria bacterium]
MATKCKPAVKSAVRKVAQRKPAVRKPAVKKPAAKKPVAKIPEVKKAAGSGPASRRPLPRSALRKVPGEALRLAGIGTDAVARATGKAWDQWLAILDKAGAVAMPHKAIASMLADRYGVPSWWSQMVTVGYEQARGLREANQNARGYAASASRTLQASLGRVYGAWADPAMRALWLGNAPVQVTRCRDGKSMNMTWTAGKSSVGVAFHPKGAGKSQVTVEHGKLADRRAVEKQKSFWGGALDRLKAMLEKAA